MIGTVHDRHGSQYKVVVPDRYTSRYLVLNSLGFVFFFGDLIL